MGRAGTAAEPAAGESVRASCVRSLGAAAWSGGADDRPVARRRCAGLWTGSAGRVRAGSVDGIRWRVRLGAPWRDVPDCYGPWQTIYGLFRRWQRAGVWARILTGLQTRADAAGLITWDVSVGSTIARAHQHAALGPAATTGCRRNHPIRWVNPNPPTTGWAALVVASPPSCIWAASRVGNLWPCW